MQFGFRKHRMGKRPNAVGAVPAMVRTSDLPGDAVPKAVQIHVLDGNQVLGASPRPSWDESQCSATLDPEKRAALEANPALRDLRAPMQVLGVRDGCVIGRMDLVAGDLCLRRGLDPGHDLVPVLWGSALFVPPEHRRTMAGLLIMAKAASIAPTVGANGPSQMAAPLYERMQFTSATSDRFILVYRSESVVARYVGNPALRRGVRAAADAVLGSARALGKALRGKSATRLRRLQAMPAEFDEALRAPPMASLLHRQTVAGHRIWGARSSRILNWMLDHRFAAEHRQERALFLVESRKGAPLGYIMLKIKFHRLATHRGFPNLTLATLADWRSFEPEGTGEASAPAQGSDFLRAAVSAAAQAGADALEVFAPKSPSVVRRMALMGFLPAGAMRCMLRTNEGSPLRGDGLPRAADWGIQYADGENTLG